MRLASVEHVGELGAARDVAPLVAAAELQRDAVVTEKVEEVQRLQQDVAELGVADAGFQTRPHHVAGQHPVDREMLADVTQEVDRRHSGPVVVVDHGGRVGPLEGEERLDLAAYPLHPVLDRVQGVEIALAGVLRVPDHSGGATDEGVRRVARVPAAAWR